MSALRSRMSRLRIIAVALAFGFGALGFRGGLWSTPSAEPTVQAFLLAWQEGQYRTAASLTDGNPAQVARALRNAYRQLNAAAFYLSMGPISQHGGTAEAAFAAWVDLGQDGPPWKYRGKFQLRQAGGSWKVAWSPSVINPELRPGLRLAVVSTSQPRALLLDASGQPLQTKSLIYQVGVRPGQVRHPRVTAGLLARITRLDPARLLGWILAAPRGSFMELVTLRPDQYQRLRGRLSRVPDLRVVPTHAWLFSSIAPGIVGSVGTETARALWDQGIPYHPGTTVGLSGLQRAYQARLAGTHTTQVVTETGSGRPVAVLKEWPGRQAQPVRTTIDGNLQAAAQAVVRGQARPSALVAVQASTGRILAVAEHHAKGQPGISPLAGRYPPGTAFTIVSTQALLASGLHVNNKVPCLRVQDVGGQIFRNEPPVRGLRPSPPFVADFAHACGTAFSLVSQNLSGQDLRAAAVRFGMGKPWQLPLPSFSGSMRADSGVARVAADTLGTGSVRASPLTMALAAAAVDSGTWHAPSLVTGPSQPAPLTESQASQPSQAGSLPASDLATLRRLMRAVVRAGAARQANLPGQPVYGQVGTVPLRLGKHRIWAGWFVGYRGGVAFAAMRFGTSPATSAVPLVQQFLASSNG